jgi:hypothetical protein
MSDQEKLVKKESNRYRVLKLFYDTVGDQRNSTLNERDVLKHLVEREGMPQEEAESAFNYLLDESLLESMTLGGGTSITHSGVKEIEASIKYPEGATRHFSAQAIQVFFQKNIVMGDKLENINNSTVVNHSEIDNSFNQSTGNEKTLAEAAAEIQELLKQFEKTNPTATEAEKITYVNIATKPDLKQRAISALKEGSNTAIDEFIVDNKYLKVVKAVIQGWLLPNI